MENVLHEVHFIVILQFDLQDVLITVNATNKSCSPGYSLDENLICYNELASLHTYCSPSTSPHEIFVSISSGKDLQQYIKILIGTGLQVIQPSAQCDLLLRHINC